jgi:hypothetical protein
VRSLASRIGAIAVALFALGLIAAFAFRPFEGAQGPPPTTTFPTTDTTQATTTTVDETTTEDTTPSTTPNQTTVDETETVTVTVPELDPSINPSRPTLSQEISLILSGLPLARVAFNAPTELHKGESAEIQLLLSLTKVLPVLKDALTKVGERHGAMVRVTDVMEARLTGPAFKIEAVTPERQLISQTDDTEWGWEIEPTRTGTQNLHLTLSALINVKGERLPRAVGVLEKPITVRVAWQERITGFVGGNWQWLWTTILVPLAALAWAAWKRRRDTSHPT